MGANEVQHVTQAPVGGEWLKHGWRVAAEGHVEQPVAVSVRQMLRAGTVGDAQ